MWRLFAESTERRRKISGENAITVFRMQAGFRMLLKLGGVGKKVADCICLFALHHIEAFPVDTHIQDMLKRYPQGFPFERYEGFAGVLQQYAFYYELHGAG